MSDETPAVAAAGRDRPTRIAAALAIVWLASGLDIVVPPLGVPTALAAVWLLARGEGGARSLGLTRPSSWPLCLGLGAVAAVAIQGVAALLSFYGLPALGLDMPDLSAFRAVQGDPIRLLGMLVVSWTTAGFGEEVIWRGFSLGRVERLLGGRRGATLVALLATSLLFGMLHAYQGFGGMLLTAFAAVLLGVLFLATGRNLWLVIVTHAMMDTIAFFLLYFFADQLGAS